MHRRVSLLASRRPFRRACSTLLKANEADAALKRPRMEELVLVRHGESEGNLAYNRSVAGDHSLYSDEFLERHSSFWRLTDQGREQALVTGEWMRSNMDVRYNSFFSSEYLRALETAALLKLPNARWKPEVAARARLGRVRPRLPARAPRRVLAVRGSQAAREPLLGAPGASRSRRWCSVSIWCCCLQPPVERRARHHDVPRRAHGPSGCVSSVSPSLDIARCRPIRRLGSNPQLPDLAVHAPVSRDGRAAPRLQVHALDLPVDLSLSDGCAWRELSPSAG